MVRAGRWQFHDGVIITSLSLHHRGLQHRPMRTHRLFPISRGWTAERSKRFESNKRGSQDIPGGWKISVVKVIAVGHDEEILQPVLVAGFVFQFVENFYLGDGWDHSWSGHGWKPLTIESCLRPMVRYFGPYAHPFPVLYRWFMILLTEHALCASTSSWEQGSKFRVHVLRSSSQDQWSSVFFCDPCAATLWTSYFARDLGRRRQANLVNMANTATL